MSVKNVQFAVTTHVATVLGYRYGATTTSAELAASVNAEPSFVRRSVTKLARAGLVLTTRGKYGSCALARPPADITLLDIYRAAEAPRAATLHPYPIQPGCPVSPHIPSSLGNVLDQVQASFEAELARHTLAELVDDVRVRNEAAALAGS